MQHPESINCAQARLPTHTHTHTLAKAPGLLLPQRRIPVAQLSARFCQPRLVRCSRLPQAPHHSLQPLQLSIPLLQQLLGVGR